jgi:hypothetical protein
MSLIQPLTQTVFEDPAKLTYMEPLSVGSYREAGVPLPQQLVGIDNGIDWGAIGANFFKQALNIYEVVQKDNIDGQADSLYNVGMDAQTQIDQLYIDSQVQLENAIRTGNYAEYDKHNAQLSGQFAGIQKKAAEKSSGILGVDDYNKFISEDVDITNYSPLYRKVAIQTRKTFFDIDTTISQRSLALEKALWDAKQASIATRKMSGANLGSESVGNDYVQNGYMSAIELNKIKPRPYTKGEVAFVDQNGKWISVNGRPVNTNVDGTPIVDEQTGAYLFDPTTKKLNPNFPKDKTPFDVIQLTADLDRSSLISPDGINMTSEAVNLLTYTINNGASLTPYDLVYSTRLVSQLNPSQISNFVTKAGANADQTEKLNMWYSLSSMNATPDQVRQMFADQVADPEASVRERDFLKSLVRNSDGNVGYNEKSPVKEDARVILNAMTNTLEERGLLKDGQYQLDETFQDTDQSNGTLIDFFSNNKPYLWLAAAVMRGVENDPSLKNLSHEERLEAMPAVVRNILTSHLSASSITNIRGTLVSSPDIQNLNTLTGVVFDNYLPTSKAGTPESKEALKAITPIAKLDVASKALLSGSYQRNFSSNDTPKQRDDITFEFVKRFNPEITREIFNAIRDTYGAVTTNKLNQRVSTELSDGFWMKVAVATKPDVLNEYANLQLSKNSKEPISMVVQSLPIKQRMQLIALAMEDIKEAGAWGFDYDEMDTDATHSDNGGLPMMIKSIGTYSGKDLLPALVSVTNRTQGNFYKPTALDGSPLLLAGRGIRGQADNNFEAQTLISKQLDGYLDDYYQDSAVIRDGSFPNETVSNDMSMLVQLVSTSKEDIQTLWKPLKYDVVVNNERDFVRWLSTNKTVLTDKDNPEAIRSFYGESSLFTSENVAILYNRGKEEGYTNASQYLALMKSVAIEAEKNTQTNGGYNYRALIEAYPTLFNPEVIPLNDRRLNPDFVNTENNKNLVWQSSNKTQEDVEIFKNSISPVKETKDLKPVYIATGTNRGLVLWDKSSPNFSSIIVDLAENQDKIIYTKRNTNEVFAFPRNEKVDNTKFEAMLYIPDEQMMLNDGLSPSFSGEGDVRFNTAKTFYDAAERKKRANVLKDIVTTTTAAPNKLKGIQRSKHIVETVKLTFSELQKENINNYVVVPIAKEAANYLGDTIQVLGNAALLAQPLAQLNVADKARDFLNKLFGFEAGIWWSEPETIKTVSDLTKESKAPNVLKMAIDKALGIVKDSPEVVLGVSQRVWLSDTETKFFNEHKTVNGMATAEGDVILNPNSNLTTEDKRKTIEKESIRLWLVKNLTGENKQGSEVSFKITEEQKKKYGLSSQIASSFPEVLPQHDRFVKHSIIIDILLKDYTGVITTQQMQEAQRVSRIISKQFPNFFTRGN